MKKNIWIINHYAIPPEYGGLNRHYYFSKYLGRMGYHVRIFTSSLIHNSGINMIEEKAKEKTREMELDGVAYTFVKACSYQGNDLSRIQNMLQFPFNLMRVYKQFEKPDVIYTSSPTPFASVQAIRLAKKLKVPVIVEVRDLWPESMVAYKGKSRKNPVIACLYQLEKWMYRNADRVVFTMEGGKDYIAERGWEKQVNLSKLYHVNNGVDLEEFTHNQTAFPVDDPDLMDPSTFKVVYTGSIREVNHIGTLVDVAKRMDDGTNNIKFIVYGDGTERQALMERCEKEGIRNLVFKGRVARRYIPFILSKADLNVIIVKQTDIMRFGCSLNKLFDYMASGKPVVSDLKVNHDLIARYQCGITTESPSAEAVEQAIKRVYEMPREQYEALCQNALRAAADYDYKKLAAQYAEIIENVEYEA